MRHEGSKDQQTHLILGAIAGPIGRNPRQLFAVSIVGDEGGCLRRREKSTVLV